MSLRCEVAIVNKHVPNDQKEALNSRNNLRQIANKLLPSWSNESGATRGFYTLSAVLQKLIRHICQERAKPLSYVATTVRSSPNVRQGD